MKTSRLTPLLALTTVLLAPTTAFAKEVAVAPFIAKGGLDPLIALNITSLVSSELDFSSEYDGALQIEEKPSGLTVACLSQSACLRKIGNASGTEHLVAGSVAPAGDQYDIYMVLYNTSGGGFVRKKTFKVATTPEKMADSMGGFVKELVTGKSPGAVQAEATVQDDFDDFGEEDYDDFVFDEETSVNTRIELPQTSTADLNDFEEEPDEWEMEQRQQEEDARRRFILKLKLGRPQPWPGATGQRAGCPDELARTIEEQAELGWLDLRPDSVAPTPAGLLRIDELLPAFYLPRHRGVRYS